MRSRIKLFPYFKGEIMLEEDIRLNVESALKEDLGGVLDPNRDISAQLIPADLGSEAAVISRESGIFCGEKWVEETLRQLGGNVDVTWFTKDGEHVKAGQELFHLKGNARVIATAERTILNFVQMLSGVATAVHSYVKEMEGTSCNLFDTRKTIPGLRTALKYAVACGGGKNHRIGLFDMFFIKGRHVQAAGGIKNAILKAREIAPDKKIDIMVESLEELKEALEAKADVIMLDNFDYAQIEEAVAVNNHQAKLEISGNVNLETIGKFAKTGVDFISVGALTKHITALEVYMRFAKD